MALGVAAGVAAGGARAEWRPVSTASPAQLDLSCVIAPSLISPDRRFVFVDKYCISIGG